MFIRDLSSKSPREFRRTHIVKLQFIRDNIQNLYIIADKMVGLRATFNPLLLNKEVFCLTKEV